MKIKELASNIMQNANLINEITDIFRDYFKVNFNKDIEIPISIGTRIDRKEDILYFIIDQQNIQFLIGDSAELSASIINAVEKYSKVSEEMEEDDEEKLILNVINKQNFDVKDFYNLFQDNLVGFKQEKFNEIKNFLENSLLKEKKQDTFSYKSKNPNNIFPIEAQQLNFTKKETPQQKIKNIDHQALTNISDAVNSSSPEEANEILDEIVQKLSPDRQDSLLEILKKRKESNKVLLGH